MEFGPPSRTSPARGAAYPFTRLRTDRVWVLDQDVPMDLVGPLGGRHVSGRFAASTESALRCDPALLGAAARILVLSNFPETVAPDVLAAAGLDPDVVLSSSDVVLSSSDEVPRALARGLQRRAPGRLIRSCGGFADPCTVGSPCAHA